MQLGRPLPLQHQRTAARRPSYRNVFIGALLLATADGVSAMWGLCRNGNTGALAWGFCLVLFWLWVARWARGRLQLVDFLQRSTTHTE